MYFLCMEKKLKLHENGGGLWWKKSEGINKKLKGWNDVTSEVHSVWHGWDQVEMVGASGVMNNVMRI